MVLEIINLNKYYGNNHVLKDVSFKIQEGNALGLLGRNGHGKSTTMKIIMGIIYANSGDVTVDGKPLQESGLKLGYLPEERGLYQKINVLEQLIYFGKLKGLSSNIAKKHSLDLLEKLEMTEYIKKKALMLSKGNQQKIQLAIALLSDPDIIILDEPYSGLDPVNSRFLQNIIEENAKKNKIILFSSHQLNTVEDFCKDICIINKGEVLIYGNLKEIKSKYPKSKVLVIPSHGTMESLINSVNNIPDIKEFEEHENALHLHLSDEKYRKDVLNEIIEKSDLESFSVMEPSLLEIFLQLVERKENNE